MNFYSVIDTGAIVWDLPDMEANERKYYALSNLFGDFIEVMKVEKPKILFRKEFREHLMKEFPWTSNGASKFWELSRDVYSFLSNTELAQFEVSEDDGTSSNPNIMYEYYSENVRTEVGYLIRELHSSVSNIKYFTFCPIWNTGENLITIKEGDEDKSYETIVHCTNELQNFIRNLRPKFEHSPKHNKLISRKDIARGYRLIDGKKIYPFSANYSHNPEYAQILLNNAISHELEPGKLYYYDNENNESPTFVCFMNTGGRVYHGFDVPENDILEPIREAVMQKHNDQGNG